MNIKLSIVVLTHNDESRIVDTLESLDFGDELIVIDDNSTDRTREIAQKYATKILTRPLDGNFASQRNFALNHVHGDWVLFVDSDEIVTDKLKQEILSSTKKGDCDGYYMRRFDFMWGRKIKHGEVGEVRILRLAKKRFGKWHGRVHESWKGQGKTGELVHPLVHMPHQSVREFLTEIDEYSSLRATELSEKGVKSMFLTIIFYPLGKFIVNYIFKKGYKDGIPGFLYAMLMSFHSFLVRSKLYLKT